MPETTSSLNDQDIVNDMLKDSKFSIHSITVALGESTSSQYREKLVSLMNSCIDEHFKLSDFAIQKNWYQPNLPLDQQLQQVSNPTPV
ncbi:spore coat protein [Desulfosporosinus sp. OT]|uniref:spore coat protein n=1 Tax=Desulfosporosinus sp. OT TaxID=913865 RepID=UPI000223AD7E|nr:spore coat protein [Desulfosporosinus sp. OT]EGW39680.1 coat F domain protein [Desulfosporosinus sp. OT]